MKLSQVLKQLHKLMEEYGEMDVGFEDPNLQTIYYFDEIEYDEEIRQCILKW